MVGPVLLGQPAQLLLITIIVSYSFDVIHVKSCVVRDEE